jgi:hypothetical protein
MPFTCSCGLECLTDEEALAEYGEFAAQPPLWPMAVSVKFDKNSFTVELSDARKLIIPIAWSPKLAKATTAQRANYTFVGRGVGIHWPDIDEDLSVRRLMVPDGEPY